MNSFLWTSAYYKTVHHFENSFGYDDTDWKAVHDKDEPFDISMSNICAKVTMSNFK